jgi:hypothetical protein
VHLTPHTSHLTPHTSHLTPHTSHLTPHTSHLTPHTSKEQLENMRLSLVQQRLGGAGTPAADMSLMMNVALGGGRVRC